MNDSQRNFCLSEMDNYSDPDAFVSDLALSSVWGDPEDSAEIPEERIEALRRLWDVVHLPIQQLLAPMSQAEACRKFYVPRRTMQDWYNNARKCPIYVRLYLARF